MLTVLVFSIAAVAAVVFLIAGHRLFRRRSDRSVRDGAVHTADTPLLRADLATESYSEHDSYDLGNTGFTRY
jgi:hypothetical protein